jgi:dehydrodolichyl diphosphate syntase complex subunit NUS1
MVVGISHVTVYDHKGYCKSQEKLLRSNLTEKTKKAGHPTLQNNLQHTNGFSKTAESSLSVLGPEDGRQQLVSVARQLGSEVANQQLPCADITVSYTDELIRAEFKFPDPDVVFRFGSVESLLGYLPWQIRLTEIFSLPTHSDLHFVDFVDALDTFADVKQRFGR